MASCLCSEVWKLRSNSLSFSICPVQFRCSPPLYCAVSQQADPPMSESTDSLAGWLQCAWTNGRHWWETGGQERERGWGIPSLLPLSLLPLCLATVPASHAVLLPAPALARPGNAPLGQGWKGWSGVASSSFQSLRVSQHPSGVLSSCLALCE